MSLRSNAMRNHDRLLIRRTAAEQQVGSRVVCKLLQNWGGGVEEVFFFFFCWQ